jgi:hypothetical protein
MAEIIVTTLFMLILLAGCTLVADGLQKRLAP